MSDEIAKALGANVSMPVAEKIRQLMDENANLLSLLGKERDAFGKKETELKAEMKKMWESGYRQAVMDLKARVLEALTDTEGV